MAENGFFTFCRRCGRQILMVRNLHTGQWTPCNAEILRFKEGTSETFIDTNGYFRAGTRSATGEVGYKEHRRTCTP